MSRSLRAFEATIALRPLSLAVVVVCELLGCGQITGVDEYAVDDAASPPRLPALPNSSRIPECEACAATECRDERAACLASAACRELLDCHGVCSDPACMFRCRDTLAKSFAFDDYFACVFSASLFGVTSFQLGADSRCGDACGVGKNWECTRRYYSDPVEPDLTLEFRFHDSCIISYGPLSRFAGAAVAPCSTIAPTGTPSGDANCAEWSTVSGQGEAILGLRGDSRSGILALRGDAEAYRIYYRHAPRSGHVDIGLTARSCVDAVVPGAVPSYDPSLGMVAFTTYDCLGSLAVGTYVELSTSSADAQGFYWADYGQPDATLKTGNRGGFVNVPAALALELSAWLEQEDSKPVSRTTILVADGWTTSVQMFPASENESL